MGFLNEDVPAGLRQPVEYVEEFTEIRHPTENADGRHDDVIVTGLVGGDIGGLAQGAGQVVDLVAHVQPAEHFGRLADFLENQRDGALFRIAVGDGQGNAFALVIDPQDDELTGFATFGNVVGFDLEELGFAADVELIGGRPPRA